MSRETSKGGEHMREWLKELRKKQGLVITEAAKLCGISGSYYEKIENGQRNVPVGTAKKIAKVLGFEWGRFYESE